jgi:hypothetical protein
MISIALTNLLTCIFSKYDSSVVSCGGYVGFDLHLWVGPDTSYERYGIHFVRFAGRAICCINDDWLFPSFDPKYEWKEVTTHDSCWPNSCDGILRDLVRSKPVPRYFSSSEVIQRSMLFPGKFEEISIEDLSGVRYVPRDQSFEECPRCLVSKGHLKKLSWRDDHGN